MVEEPLSVDVDVNGKNNIIGSDRNSIAPGATFTQIDGHLSEIIIINWKTGSHTRDDFSSSHAFPSWSAAVYREGEIHLRNPHHLLKKGILENVLSHEFFHAVIRQNGLFLPQWFEEGFAYFLFPASLQELNGKMNDEDSSKIKALDFYSDSYIMVRKLMEGKSQREIQDFFLFCKEVDFYTASQKYFKISVY
jgi:hypothetical protein